MFWMRAYPLRGQVGGGLALPLPLAQVMDAHIQNIMHWAV